MRIFEDAIIKNEIEKILNIFKALSFETRLKIVVELIEKEECSVNKIAEELNIPQPNVSQHLATLKNARIIEGFRKGTQIYYKVIDEQTKNVIKVLNVH